jgi:hypothetical protein
MTFVPVEEISEVFEQAFGNRIITPVMLGEDPAKKDGVVVPMRRRTEKRAPIAVERKRSGQAARRTAVTSRKR